MLKKPQALEILRQILAADCACHPGDFLQNHTVIVEAKKIPGRRRFPWPAKQLLVVSMGKNAVISCDKSYLPFAQQHLSHFSRDEVFEAAHLALLEELVSKDKQLLAGPDLKYCCTEDTLRQINRDSRFDWRLYHKNEIPKLYQHEGFGMALSYDENSSRPDTLATAAYYRSELVGVACASEDSDQLWQVGVHVAGGYHGQGIGTTLVAWLTGEILARGRLPYYSTTVVNLASRQLALRAGYWPAWVELYSR